MNSSPSPLLPRFRRVRGPARRHALPLLRLALAALLAAAATRSGAEEGGLLRFPEKAGFLPPTWLEEPILAEIEPLQEEAKEAVERILGRAFAKYPETVLSRNLEGVYLVSSLKFYGVAYGGTYMASSRRIVLVYRAAFDETAFEQRFHHELSSILLKRHLANFDEKRWALANPPQFEYRAGGVIEEQSGDRSEATRVLEEEQERTGGSGSGLLHLNPKLMAEGFLTAYNRVSVEQDVNETAAHLFTNDALWTYCLRFPRLDHKVDVLIDFYRSVDPAFDRLYFRRLTSGEGPDPSEEMAGPSSTPAAPSLRPR